MKALSFILILLYLSTGCSKSTEPVLCQGFDTIEANISDSTAYAIWSDILPQKGSEPFIVIQSNRALDSASAYWLEEDTLAVSFEVDSSIIYAYVQANDSTEYWDNRFNPNSILISQDELNCFFKQSTTGWDDYYKQYNTGFWDLSKPAVFGNYALVHYSYSCGNLCAESAYLLLKKVNGKWIIVKHGAKLVS